MVKKDFRRFTAYICDCGDASDLKSAGGSRLIMLLSKGSQLKKLVFTYPAKYSLNTTDQGDLQNWIHSLYSLSEINSTGYYDRA